MVDNKNQKLSPKSRMVDKVKLKGFLEIIRISDDGKRESIYKKKNLIVDTGRESVIILLSADDEGINDKTIGFMSWGDGGHDTGNPTLSIPPDPSDTALVSEHAATGKRVVTHDFPDSTTVRFIATIAKAELNGLNISEIGLFTKDLTMFSRRTFGAILKTSEFSFEFRWSILA